MIPEKQVCSDPKTGFSPGFFREQTKILYTVCPKKTIPKPGQCDKLTLSEQDPTAIPTKNRLSLHRAAPAFQNTKKTALRLFLFGGFFQMLFFFRCKTGKRPL